MGRFWSNFFTGPAGGPPGHVLPCSAPRFLFYGPLLPSGNIKFTMGSEATPIATLLFSLSIFSRFLLDNNNVAIVKKRKKTKKRKKRKIWGEGCFGERPNPKITTSLFDFLANGSAALLALANPRPGFLQQARIFIHGLAGPKQHLPYFCDCDWPRATAPVVLC